MDIAPLYSAQSIIQVLTIFIVAILIFLSAKKISNNQKEVSKKKLFLFSLMSVSPIGIPVIYILSAMLKVCDSYDPGRGIYDISCPAFPVIGGYVALIGEFFTTSLLVGIGIIWLVAAMWIWFKTLSMTIAFFLRTGSK